MVIQAPTAPITQPISSGFISSPQATSGQQIIEIEMPDNPQFWNPLLQEVVFKYEAIYHSTIAEKLRKISEKKWYQIF
jgi:hypothetical protein